MTGFLDRQLEREPPNRPAKRRVVNAKKIMVMITGIVGAGLAAAYVLLSPFFAMPLYNNFLFYPRLYDEDRYGETVLEGVTRKEVFFTTSDQKKLHGWLFRLPRSSEVVLVHHGNAGNLSSRLSLAATLLRNGASVFLYDYRGYGRSCDASPDIEGICQDGISAYDYLVKQEAFQPAKVVQYGESIGTGVACHVLQRRESGGLILQSGFSSLPAISKERLGFLNIYPTFLFPSNCLDNVAALRKTHPPLLILHGSEDATIPCWHSQVMYKEALEPKKLVLLGGTDHNNVGQVDPDIFGNALAEFFKNLPNS